MNVAMTSALEAYRHAFHADQGTHERYDLAWFEQARTIQRRAEAEGALGAVAATSDDPEIAALGLIILDADRQIVRAWERAAEELVRSVADLRSRRSGVERIQLIFQSAFGGAYEAAFSAQIERRRAAEKPLFGR